MSTEKLRLVANLSPAESSAGDSAYDAWLRKHLETRLREADDLSTVWYTNEEVMEAMDQLVAEAEAREVKVSAS